MRSLIRRRLTSWKAIVAYVVLILVFVNAAVGTASNIDFVLTASGNSRLVTLWKFFATPKGNLLAVILAVAWITILVFWPERKAEADETSAAEKKLERASTEPAKADEQEARIKELDQEKGVLNEPKIIGRIKDEFHYLDQGAMGNTLYVAISVHLMNDGIPTVIQGFRLKMTFLGKEYSHHVKLPCSMFNVVRLGAGDKYVSHELASLEELSGEPLVRHIPRDGWLCFNIRDFPNVLDRVGTADMKLYLVVIDGAEHEHTIVGAPQVHFSSEEKLVRKR